MSIAALVVAGFTLTGVNESTLPVRVIDAQTRAPLEGAFVVAREIAVAGRLHGSDTFCIRADVATSGAQPVQIRLPEAAMDQVPLLERSHRAIEALAFRKGYCVARSADAAMLAEDRRIGSSSNQPGSVPVARAGAMLELAARPSTQGPEERLLYLVDVARNLHCGGVAWGTGAKKALPALAAALRSEAGSLAKTKYDRSIVRKMDDALLIVESMQPLPDGVRIKELSRVRAVPSGPRDFLIGDSTSRPIWDDRRGMAIVSAGSGSSASVALASVPAGQAPPPAIVRQSPMAGAGTLAIHCRHGALSTCDLNERDEGGRTALFSAVRDLNVDQVKLLLDARADPTIAVSPFGEAPLDALLARVARSPSISAEDASKAQAIVALLAASPLMALRKSLKDDLDADPAQWRVAYRASLPVLVAARDSLRAIPARPDPAPACEMLGPELRDGFPPLRLR